MQENSKTGFVENIREWIHLDNESKQLWEKMKEIREKKRDICEKIHKYANETGLQKTRIDISDGSLRFIEKKEFANLSLQYVESSLGKFIEDEDVKIIMAFIRENRTMKFVRDISRTYMKKSQEMGEQPNTNYNDEFNELDESFNNI